MSPCITTIKLLSTQRLKSFSFCFLVQAYSLNKTAGKPANWCGEEASRSETVSSSSNMAILAGNIVSPQNDAAKLDGPLRARDPSWPHYYLFSIIAMIIKSNTSGLF